MTKSALKLPALHKHIEKKYQFNAGRILAHWTYSNKLLASQGFTFAQHNLINKYRYLYQYANHIDYTPPTGSVKGLHITRAMTICTGTVVFRVP